jgi:uracil-DNA glycosylase
MTLTPLDRVKAVILGQDPYPTPGDAHGLAFSYVVPRGGMPSSLKVVIAELAEDLSIEKPTRGDLTPWARLGRAPPQHGADRGAGHAGANLMFGWSSLADQAIRRVGPAAGRGLLPGEDPPQAGGPLDATSTG